MPARIIATGLLLALGVAFGSALAAKTKAAPEPVDSYLLIARPYASTNVYVLDSGLTADDCTYDLETFTPAPQVELEPGVWIDRDSVQMSCTLDGEQSKPIVQ